MNPADVTPKDVPAVPEQGRAKPVAPATLSAIDSLVADHSADELFAIVHARKRLAIHNQQKGAQPAVSVVVDDDQWSEIVDAMRAPLTPDDAQPIDYLCQIVQDCVSAGNREDTLFALVRLWRAAWQLQPHLGPMEAYKGL